MRLLFLCKRRPQGRDLLTRPYGRFFYLPYYLAQRGHDVTLLLMDYRPCDLIHRRAHGIEWFSVSVHPLKQSSGPIAYFRQAEKFIKTQKPDWIIGFSDTWYGILATYLGERYCVKSLIDAYDNYESYIPWLKPLHWLWRNSLQRCTAISAAGPQLAELMSRGRVQNVSTIIPMAADPIFQPLSGVNFRQQFELSEGIPLVGYCGSLYSNRGVELLFQAMEYLLNWIPEAKLVITGRRDRYLKIPKQIRHAIIELGYLPDEKIPIIINSMDVLLVINRQSAFGDYSYPVKLYEAMKCHKAVIASNSAGASWILRNHPECLADSDNPIDLARHILDALAWKTKEYNSNQDWEFSARILQNLLESL
ncbi:glycosyltransferase [Methylomonas sp. MK1]|uniref:glycosyltransferase n=1 Tax=Methylomonas sp. MK1 TaxID=1131552 RepID=UPI0003A09D05|nr:glycosyltransferase [Methylomonas sp. MK1]